MERRSNPFRIGITGGIGSGKTIVSKIFSSLGVPVYHADDRAKWLMNTQPALIEAIRMLIGKDAYTADGIDRNFVSKQVFHQPDLLNKLNSLVHPAVGKDFEEWATIHKKQLYLLKEAALIFESGSHQMLDKIILVTAPADLRIRRVLQRDSHRTQEDVKAIIANQWPDGKKVELADFVIINDDTRLVIPQVLEIHQKLTSD